MANIKKLYASWHDVETKTIYDIGYFIRTAFLMSSSLKGQVNSPMKGTWKGSADIVMIYYT